MLSLIRVKNYAVIDEIEVEFGGSLNVMTGETGAGKSILVDALGLALGDRADASAVRHDAERAEISVSFDIPAKHAAAEWLRQRDLDDDTACTLRRVLGRDGRSRAFINGQPVNLQDLKDLGALLVDIHGQHAHQSLLEAGNQRALLDAHGGLDALAATVAEQFALWQGLVAQLETRRTASAQQRAEIELLRFQIAELESLALADGELDALVVAVANPAMLPQRTPAANRVVDARGQLVRIDRLGNVIVHAGFQTMLAIAFHCMGSHCDDRQMRATALLTGANRGRCLITVHIRHVDIHENNVRT